jgi:hypothetical protein
MRRLVLAAVSLLFCPIAVAQMLCHAMAGPGGISPCAKKLATAVRQEEFGKAYWPAVMDNLKSSPGLPFFRQGLTQYYGLDYEEAMRNFKEAKKDPSLTAMASWGIALAAGPNINLNMTDACLKLACEEIGCADSVAAGISKEGCAPGNAPSDLEKELIAALKKRYVCKAGVLPKEADAAAKAYSDAMAVVSTKYPNDKNVSTLYGESMMDLYPWDQYDKAGLPIHNTETIVRVLKSAIGTSEEAIGANHFYIHAVEASSPEPKIGNIHPVDALPSANLLQTQVTKSGHLVHMSSHIYLLVGKYMESLSANIKGSNNDVEQYGQACSGPYGNYTTNDKCPQLYYGHYLSHNYFFGSVSSTFLGQSKSAMALACDTQAHVQRFVSYEPALQRYLSAPLMTMVVNRNWDAICAETDCKGLNPSDPNFVPPKFENCYRQDSVESPCYVLRSIWYWARGMARTAYGIRSAADLKAVNADLSAMGKEIASIPTCTETNKTSENTFGNNCARDVLNIGYSVLNARIAWAQVDQESAQKLLNKAVLQESDLVYDEPPQWFTPTREDFGGFFLQVAKHAPSYAASDYYREALSQFERALVRHPASGRALYGKMRALEGLKSDDFPAAKVAFDTAWKPADYQMTDADLWPDWYKAGSEPSTEAAGPSKCACKATIWPPLTNTQDVRAGEVNTGVYVNDALLRCPPTTRLP